MKQLDNILDYYLKNDSNYAIMITGDWGIGKTYYFKKKLAKQIKETPTFNDASKKYKTITISLFGLSSIEEIQTEIFLSIYPLLKNKTLKLGASIAKSLVKGILRLKGLEEYGEIISEVETDKKEWINFNEIVVCFDDFERLSENLSIEELVGYINSLVESESVKIIILANEDKISKENYYALKEKIIGNSIEFIQDINTAFDGLIQEKFSGFPEYNSFLKQYKKYIIEIFILDSTNLRTLNFILNYFQTIYSSYITFLSATDILKEYEEEIFKKLIKFTIAIGCFYKTGKISFKNRENLEEFGFFDFGDLNFDGFEKKKEKSEEEKNVREKFIDKYYKEDLYNFFPSVYEFITGGSNFSPSDLISELKSHLHIQDNNVPTQYEIYNKLCYPQVYLLKDSEYNSLTRQMLIFSDQGKYELHECLTIFYFATRFNNPLNLDLEKIEKRIVKSLQKGINNFSYVPSIDTYLNIDDSSSYKEHLEKIKEVAIEINESLIQNLNNEKYREIESLYSTDFENFKLCLIDKNRDFAHEPIFENFNVRDFYSFFINANGQIKWQIIAIFKSRYPQYAYSGLKPELKFLEKLSLKIEKKVSSLPTKGITSHVYNEFYKTLKLSTKILLRDEAN